MIILSVVGARPNFMKIAPFIRAIKIFNNNSPSDKIQHILVHTGQHYDDKMSKNFFESLDIPDADINLGIGSGTHAEQVGRTMIEFESVLRKIKPDWVVVVGDVNATLACSVTAKKEWIKCCHIEAGLRSGDLTMPEEINRLVTDRISDLLLTPDRMSIENLKREGIDDNKIKFVGNIMIDTLEANRSKSEKLDLNEIVSENWKFGKMEIDNTYALMTLHRPSNVDIKDVFVPIITFLLNEVASKLQLIWTIHPRTLKKLETFKLLDKIKQHPNITILEPLNYLDMLRLNMSAKILITDSGGLQEECSVLGTPCLTLRWNTERPITLRENGGLSVLVGNNVSRIREEFNNLLNLERNPTRPELWDGRTAERCLDAILNYNTKK